MKEEQDIKLRILRLHDLLSNHELRANDIADIYREYVKLSICLGTNSPMFKENLNKYKYVNCYAYALGLYLPDSFYNRYNEVDMDGIRYNLGFISNEVFAFNLDKQLNNLYKDLEALNIRFYETNQNAQNEHGGYKIAMYNFRHDFHMIRQNYDGSWSEKKGYSFKFKQRDNIEEHYYPYELVKVLEIVKPTIR